MIPLIDIIRKIQKKHPKFSTCVSEATALANWERMVGKIIAQHARAIRIKEKTLWVEVDHPAWKAELTFRKANLLEKLNESAQSPLQEPTSKGDRQSESQLKTSVDGSFVECNQAKPKLSGQKVINDIRFFESYSRREH